MTAPQTADVDKPYRGRRLSWAEFTSLTGRPAPTAANDNAIETKGSGSSSEPGKSDGWNPFAVKSRVGATNNTQGRQYTEYHC